MGLQGGGFAQQLGARGGMPGLHALQQGMAAGGGGDAAAAGVRGFGELAPAVLQGMSSGGGGGMSQDMMRFHAYQQQMREQAALKARSYVCFCA